MDDDHDDDMIVIAEAERDVLLVLFDIDSLTNINDVCSDEEEDNGSISKHGGVVTRFSINFAREGPGEEELFDNEDDARAEGR